MPVKITEQNLQVLKLVAEYYVLTRAMIQNILFPHVRGPRSVCERLRKLVREGYLSVATMEVVLRNSGSSAPVYYPNKKTAETLAAILDDPSFEKICCKPPSSRLLFHWLEISQMHRVVDSAVELSNTVKLHRWVNEWQPINFDDKPSELFTLYSEFDKVQCAPDAGMLIENKLGALKIFYCEADRGTISLKRLKSKKFSGYNRAFELQRHFKHFPSATVSKFSVLFVTTTQHRRDELASAAKEYDPHGLWKFAHKKDVSPDTFFFEPIWIGKEMEPHVLITA